jgi:hypothetical protein
MKNLMFCGICVATLLSSCATYNVTLYNEAGDVEALHTTEELYVGTDAFILDVVIDPFLMLYSLFNPLPSLVSSVGQVGGIDLGSYIAGFAALAPVSGVIAGDRGENRITFDANDGNRYSYEGFKYTLTRESIAKRKTKDEVKEALK